MLYRYIQGYCEGNRAGWGKKMPECVLPPLRELYQARGEAVPLDPQVCREP